MINFYLEKQILCFCLIEANWYLRNSWFIIITWTLWWKGKLILKVQEMPFLILETSLNKDAISCNRSWYHPSIQTMREFYGPPPSSSNISYYATLTLNQAILSLNSSDIMKNTYTALLDIVYQQPQKATASFWLKHLRCSEPFLCIIYHKV